MNTPPFKRNGIAIPLASFSQPAPAAFGGAPEHMLEARCSQQDFSLAVAIMKRAVEMAKEYQTFLDPNQCLMDIVVCHCNGCPLHLLRLLMSDPEDFSHDVLGIAVHIDRKSGRLCHGFIPRFAVNQNPA